MLLKNSLKKIKKSFGRYLSLLTIIFIGVFFYSGIIESVPNIKNVQSNYYDDTNLMDIKLISTLGFNDADIDSILKVDGVLNVVGSYSKDVLVNNDVVRVHAIEENINKSYLIDGRMPDNNYECLADADFYDIGDIIEIDSRYTDNFESSSYKVVGTIYSPIYTSDDYGSSDIGNGKLHSYIYIPKDSFKIDYYTEAFVNIKKDSDDLPYSDSYNKKVDNVIDKIEGIKQSCLDERIMEIVHNSYGMVSKESFSEADWFFLTRDDVVSSYAILEDQYGQVTVIANVIPIFFILIVILMTTNTMARMIIEERGEMGTFISLGYSKFKIVSNYLMYVLSATLIGSILGFFTGTIFLPRLVYNCFPINFPPITYNFRMHLFLICVVVSCLVMSGVTIILCLKELQQKPAYLLRPVAPKKGKTIFLESFNFIWKRLSFSSKITFRNIFRYKQRALMTLVGTAGCTFLIMIGFGLRDSINTVGTVQYSELFRYDNLIVLNNNVKSITDLKDCFDGLVTDELLLNQSSFKVVDDDNSLDVYMLTPETTGSLFKDYFQLRDSDNLNEISLMDDGVIITPKLQERFNVNVGDYLTVESLDKKKYKLKVSAVAENYVSNYIYMSKDLYGRTFGEDISYNVVVSKNITNKDKIATELLKDSQILTVNFSDDLLETADNMVKGLNEIVILLVIISSLLAFTVLYNLTSINISERTREIATLKVLGFRELESNAYIYRETLITVIIGIGVGLLITPPLHRVVMSLLEVDVMTFLKKINLQSYFLGGILNFVFALIMQVITFFKLKKINMIESLKSVE